MTEGPATATPRLVVGLVRGLHGLRGAVRVEVLTDDPARFEPGRVVFPEGSAVGLTILEAHADGQGLLMRFQERPDRTSVEDLRGRYLEAVAPSEPLPAGEFYWHEVTGLTAVDLEGAELGRVVDVFRAGGSEVFVVQGPRGELMIPGVASVVRELAPHEGRIVVDTDALGLDDQEPRSKVRGRRTTRARKAAERGEGTTLAASGGDNAADGAEQPADGAERGVDGAAASTTDGAAAPAAHGDAAAAEGGDAPDD